MAENRALIIVDVQPTFCEGGALGVEGGNEVAEKIADFVTENADEYGFIVTTQDWHIDPGSHFAAQPDFVDTWPEHAVAGTPEAELHEAIAALSVDDAVKKGEYAAAYSGFEGKNRDGDSLEMILRAAEVDAVDVVGIAESHCVKATALDALKAGWPVRVLSDLTVAVSPELGESARAEMDEAGVEQISAAEAFGFYEEGEDAPIPGDDSWSANSWDDQEWDSESGSWEDDEWEEDWPDDADTDGWDSAPAEGEADTQRAWKSEMTSATKFDDEEAWQEEALAATGENPTEIDLDEFDLDLEIEDVDFSDDADESDFDFSDIDFRP